MIIYLKESEWTKLFNHYMNKGWQTDKLDRRMSIRALLKVINIYKTIREIL